MTHDEACDLVRRYIERVWNSGDLDLVDELVAPRYRVHAYGISFVETPEMHRDRVMLAREGTPDHFISLEDVIADGAKVVARTVTSGTYTGTFTFPGGRKREVVEQPFHVHEITIHRIEDGRLAECWQQGDRLDFLKQLGLLSYYADM